jgi:hypothetical protein
VPGGESSNSGLFGPEKEVYHWAVHRIFWVPLEKNNFYGRQIECVPFIMLPQIVYYMKKADVDMCHSIAVTESHCVKMA